MKWIKQLFCRHEYKLIQTITYTGYEGKCKEFQAKCRKCGKESGLKCVEVEASK